MKKIAIATSCKLLNYGSILQAYALQKFISLRGYEVYLLWWKSKKESHRDIRFAKICGMFYRYIMHPYMALESIKSYCRSFSKSFSNRSISLIEKFENNNLHINYASYNEMKIFSQSEKCCAVIAGSDQIWDSYTSYVDPFYFLRFAPQNKRIAYAPSLGKNDIPKWNRRILKKYISEFKCLSVRESRGEELLEPLIGKKVSVVLDPTFLLKKDEWLTLMVNMDFPKEYILLYFLDEPNSATMVKIHAIIEKYNLPVIALPYEFEQFKSIGNIRFLDAGPAEFISLIYNSRLILTDSFHGCALSINLNKQFWVFNRQYAGKQTQISRIWDLLILLDLTNRFVINDSKQEYCEDRIDFERVNNKLELLRNFSENYLMNSIESCEV